MRRLLLILPLLLPLLLPLPLVAQGTEVLNLLGDDPARPSGCRAGRSVGVELSAVRGGGRGRDDLGARGPRYEGARRHGGDDARQDQEGEPAAGGRTEPFSDPKSTRLK